jgi:general secretion pathway protein D
LRRSLAPLLAVLLATAPAAIAPARAQDQVLNVQDADIRAFIQDVSRVTGYTFIVDPRVRGTVSVSSNGALSKNELFEVFLSTLRGNGLVAVPTAGGAYRIAPAEGAAQQPSGPGAVRFATEVFRLRSMEPAAAAALLKPLVGPQGQVTAAGGALVVADYADNLARIRGLIAQIDQDRSAMQTVTLQFSAARELAGVLNDLIAGGAGGPAGARSALVSVIPVESSNSLILRGEPAAVQRLLPIIADLDRRAEARGDIQVVRLQNADAAQILPVLQQITGQTVSSPFTSNRPATPSSSLTAGNSSGQAGATAGLAAAAAAASPPASAAEAVGGSGTLGASPVRIARYPGANALVISAPPEMQRTLANVIRQLDVRREQVLVEAIVVEVSDKAAKELGVSFLLGGDNGFAVTNYSNTGPNILALTGAIAGQGVLPDATVASMREAAISSITGTNGITSGIGGKINNDAMFGLIVNAVKQDVASNLLSTPSVLTLDNEDAKILVGQQIPITTGEVLGSNNANPFRTVQRQDVGIQLQVKPQINAGGAITLFLRQEVSSVAGPVVAGSSDLITNTREIETTVLVDDGDIVVLGGLLGHDQTLNLQKVPGLGDLPGIGGLFRSKVTENNRTNLMVFIRPTIIRTPSAAQAATAPRYDYIRDAQAATTKDGVSSMDQLVRDYMRALPPSAPQGQPQVSTPPVSAAPIAPAATR